MKTTTRKRLTVQICFVSKFIELCNRTFFSFPVLFVVDYSVLCLSSSRLFMWEKPAVTFKFVLILSFFFWLHVLTSINTFLIVLGEFHNNY